LLFLPSDMKKYYFYLARCNDKTLYAGYTTDLKNREQTHNNGKGAKYTRSRTPIKIVYWEKFKTKTKALQREAEIKSWKKIKKENLIKNFIPG
jgi:putative endonuclease